MDVVALVAGALWAMLPAYVPNNAAVLFGGGAPIDGGREFGGSRLLGDGKTWRGTAGGVAAGVLVAGGLNVLRRPTAAALDVPLVGFVPAAALGLSAGAMLGDVGASFLKRRIDRKRGRPAPGLDQLDFVVGALALAALVAPGWVAQAFSLPALGVVLLCTPLLHLAMNVLAYTLDLKPEPW